MEHILFYWMSYWPIYLIDSIYKKAEKQFREFNKLIDEIKKAKKLGLK